MVSFVFDTETENHVYYGRKASPFCPDNYPIAIGWQIGDKPVEGWYTLDNRNRQKSIPIDDTVDVIVGHNVKFDLHMCWTLPVLQKALKRGCKIWCTQYAEYLLEGMHPGVHMLAMDDVVERYGGKKKIDEVKLMWKAGYLTSEISQKLLMEYLLEGDVPNTKLMYENQVKRAKEMGMLTMIETRMEGLLATTEMEYNGIYVDREVAFQNLGELNQKIDSSLVILNKYVPETPEGFTFNWGSATHKSCLFFGGTIAYKQKGVVFNEDGSVACLGIASAQYIMGEHIELQPVLLPNGEIKRYKGGKRRGEAYTQKVIIKPIVKTKMYDKFVTFPGFIPKRKHWMSASSTDARGNPLYSLKTDNIIELCVDHAKMEVFQAYKEYAVYAKDRSTYYINIAKNGTAKGMLMQVDRDTNLIHHSLQHTSTVTGRLSCTNPNMQTIPKGGDDGDMVKSKVKEMFTSRFGKDGRMIEADYSQLEVVVQGALTEDPQLCEDLRNRIDFHCKRMSIKIGVAYDLVKKIVKDKHHALHKDYCRQRSGIKGFSFQRAYGAGAAAIAYSTGMNIDDVKDLIELEMQTYAGVETFYKRITRQIQDSATRTIYSAAAGCAVKRGEYISPTGTIYTFIQTEAPAFMKKNNVFFAFTPTQIKNYPVQGTGGEMVQTVLGKLYRHFKKLDNYNGKALLINTVHDCVWIDCHKDVLRQVADDIKPIMESIPAIYKELFNWHIDVPFPVEVEAGLSMATLENINED